ncbi:hypothetical protein MCW82_07055 [Azospirillum doebereinerae]|uniref:hypothetical protein n=1 Tax=Azospirillum doebereinerae TaxID=92933 RepID=UPI001EE5B1D3|nr:hypothetical protein [Azospirillum doebereinerae]MCG5239525.1 hypothetical protein [Azospirillum doebereinerae]
MASLKSLKKNTAAINDGQWVSVTLDDGDTIRVRSRGVTDAYRNAQSRQQQNAAKGFGGDVAKLPVELKRAINCRVLAEHAFLDLAGLDDDGRAVTAEEVKDILRDRQQVVEYASLVDALFTAQAMVDEGLGEDRRDAEGNSAPYSGTL